MTARDAEYITDPSDPIAQLRGRMSPVLLAKADRMAAINSKYVVTERDAVLDRHLDEMLVNIAQYRKGEDSTRSMSKIRALFVLGEAGSGKSTAVARMLARRPELRPVIGPGGETMPLYLSIEAPKPLSLTLLSRKGLKKLGYPISRTRGTQYDEWDLFKEQIKHHCVPILYLDEMQHTMRGTTGAEVMNLGDVFKSLLQIDDFPLHVIFSGMPSLANFRMRNEQLMLRSIVEKFEPADPADPDDVAAVAEVVNGVVERHAELRADPGLRAEGFVRRLIHGCSGAFGTQIQMTRRAAFICFGDTDANETVMPRHFEQAYFEVTGCARTRNVFTARDWQELKPELALSDMLERYEKRFGVGRKGNAE